uniref:SAP domain-containing protein n=1 Tax=Panagrolaimus sp. PS1159 TaxID=55785 RepID=A0AC35GDQ4_9BILA
MSDTLDDGRHVDSLKVVELRDELGKRGLSKSGNKKELADRLRTYLITGTGEVSDKSASHSPVKSPVNSLIAQYRSTQQQLLKDAQKEPEPLEPKEEVAQNVQDEVVDNGHKETNIQESAVKINEQKVETPTKEQQETFIQEVKEQSPMEEDGKSKEIQFIKEEESLHVQEFVPNIPENNEKVVKDEEIPKALTPIADRERSKTPERELSSPPNEHVQNAVENKETPKADAIDRAISEEPADEEEEKESTPPRKNIHQVSGGESDTESQSPTPKSQSDSKNQEQKPLNGNDKHSTNEEDVKVHPISDANQKKSEVYTEGIVYVNNDNVKPQPKTSQTNDDSTPDGLVRHKSVSPARYPPSNYIYIRGLRRPFTMNQFHAVVLKFGTFTKDDDEWMDNVRSQSIIKYSTVEEAQKAREGLHHVVWPEFNNGELLVDFSDETEFIQHKGVLKKVIKPDDDVFVKEKSPSPMNDDLPSPKESVKRERHDDDTDEGPSPKKKKEKKSLEELFKKTIAQPSICYMPLSDEEVARKQVQKAMEKRVIKDSSSEPLPLVASSSTTRRRDKSPSPLPPASRRKSRSPQRKSGQLSPRRRSPFHKNRDGLPPRYQRSPRRLSPPSKRRSPSPRRSPPSSRKPATTSTASPSGMKTASLPLPHRRSPSPLQRRRSPSPKKR